LNWCFKISVIRCSTRTALSQWRTVTIISSSYNTNATSKATDIAELATEIRIIIMLQWEAVAASANYYRTVVYSDDASTPQKQTTEQLIMTPTTLQCALLSRKHIPSQRMNKLARQLWCKLMLLKWLEFTNTQSTEAMQMHTQIANHSRGTHSRLSEMYLRNTIH